MTIRLSDEIEDDSFRYRDLIAQVQNIDQSVEEVRLELNCRGGGIDAGIELYNLFKQCVVPVQVVVKGPCRSMAAILALSGSSLTMNPGTFLMFHNYSSSHSGKGAETKDEVLHLAEWSKELDFLWLCPFLTEAEVKRISEDKDVRINWNDKTLKDRIARHFGEPLK